METLMTVTDIEAIDLSDVKWRDDPALLQNALLSLLPTAVVINANVSRPVDTLIVQLVLSARRSADAAGVPFSVQEASDPFRSGLKLLGLHNDILG